VGANPVLRLGQHAAGAAGRIADGDDDAGLGEHAGVGLQQQVDHELDDFARGEVVAGRFVGGFVEAPDQVFEHQPHGDVVDLARMQVDLGELGDHLIEAIGFFELLDLLFELEALEDLADVLGEAVDVSGQMLADVVRVALELLEVELAVVVKAQRVAVVVLGQVVEDGVDIGIFLVFSSAWRLSTASLLGASTASKRRSTVSGSITRSYCGGGTGRAASRRPTR
jgi:hypothetical protein